MGKVYPEGTFVTNRLSKDRFTGGYKLGSCVLPTTASKLALDYKKVAATVYANLSTPTQYATVKAYKPSEEIEDYINTTRQIHRIMGNYLSEQWNSLDGIIAIKPEGIFYFFTDFNSLSDNLKKKGINTSNQLVESLLSYSFYIAIVTSDV